MSDSKSSMADQLLDQVNEALLRSRAQVEQAASALNSRWWQNANLTDGQKRRYRLLDDTVMAARRTLPSALPRASGDPVMFALASLLIAIDSGSGSLIIAASDAARRLFEEEPHVYLAARRLM